MRLAIHSSFAHLLSLLILLVGFAVAAEPTRYTLAYAPLASTSKPTAFAVLIATPTTRNSPIEPGKLHTRIIWSLESYTAPRKETAAWARIGLLDGAGKHFNGSTTRASVAALAGPDSHAAELYLQLNAAGRPVSVALRDVQCLQEKADGEDSGRPRLLVMSAAPEPKPLLNKPVILNSEGRVDEPPKEKTLLQK